MARTATCRIVVATSYHAAVFALACGIPAVCVVATPYYGAKMGGLADQFGPACTVVPAVGEEFPDRLQSAMRSAWNAAPELRTACRTVADARIADAEAAYDTLSSLVA
jgi:colanic acid/amylovoran biosynthesis protein